MKDHDMTPAPAPFDALAALLGARFSISAADRDHHAGHETHHAPQPPDAVVWPETTDEVAQIVRICANARVPVIAHGLGSSLEAQVAAVRGGVSIDLMRMNRVLAVRPDDQQRR